MPIIDPHQYGCQCKMCQAVNAEMARLFPDAPYDDIVAALPPGYMSHLPVPERVKHITDQWRRAVEVNKELQAKCDRAHDALADLEEYAILMKTRIEQVDAPPTGGKE